jgi:hypothetical protein
VTHWARMRCVASSLGLWSASIPWAIVPTGLAPLCPFLVMRLTPAAWLRAGNGAGLLVSPPHHLAMGLQTVQVEHNIEGVGHGNRAFDAQECACRGEIVYNARY